MRFLHTADWHIGKKLHGFDLMEEQNNAFEQVKKIALEQKVDAIVIAGDLYDRALPNEAAVEEMNQMIIELNLKLKKPILAISGNHDSATRLNTGHDWFKTTQYFLNTNLADALHPIEFEDTQFFLLPYFQPYQARNLFEDTELIDVKVALKRIIKEMKTKFDPKKKHVLTAHFFVTGSSKTDSETKVEVGGLNAVPTDLLQDFDYVALGHLHDKDALREDRIRYSGSLLKFSVSEATIQKGVWIVDTDPFKCTFMPIIQPRDIIVLTKSYQELISPEMVNQIPSEAYVAIRLTDKAIIPDIMNNLRNYYPRIISLERAYGREKNAAEEESIDLNLGPMELLTNFFNEITDEEISSKQKKWAAQSLNSLEKETNL
ncbi:exonuclease SbcD [Liquorilactobacillus aquaticus DSM 21051]|uniref:Nuclease SbcCD subunit D n=1 Tax=Liquorilactobacillus aquaticus DSM 21051 TaxID=1423725 RepID=A0A0R2CU28_9LACO|nr:exonuclease SbcCD subunit D [Liquorilactobacillus aquaticus]KRM95281.1 exonuclease SbcD [Liquorilactobacillus aquaticus DSM 21051]